MKITERQKEILNFLIQDYLSTRKPVASKRLVNDYRLSYSSATVRIEMAELERIGYLSQSHCSAGRIPTDQAYRYFVDYLLEANIRVSKRKFNRVKKEIDGLLNGKDFGDLESSLKRLLFLINQLSQTLSIFFLADDQNKKFEYLGLDAFLGLVEEDELNEVRKVCRWLSNIEVNPNYCWWDEFYQEQIKAEGRLSVYIGQENPIQEMRYWTTVMIDWPIKSSGWGLLGIIGPREMDYLEMISLMEMIREEMVKRW